MSFLFYSSTRLQLDFRFHDMKNFTVRMHTYKKYSHLVLIPIDSIAIICL